MAKKAEKITADLEALIDSGMGSESKTFKFETAISKLLERPKHSVTRKLPVAENEEEVELICEAVGVTLLEVANKALSQMIRTHYVGVEQAIQEKKEVEAVNAAMSSTPA